MPFLSTSIMSSWLRIRWCRWLHLAACAVILVSMGCRDDPTRPSTPPVIDSPAAVVGALADAYQALDFDRFARLVAADPAAEFRFVPLAAAPDGSTQWDAGSEFYLHRRMFEPAAVPASEPPVPPGLHLRRVDLAVVEVVPFTSVANSPPDLDPARWKLFTGTYDLDAFFDTESPNDYRVGGRAELEVVQDLSKHPGEEGRFLLYTWREGAAMGARETRAGVRASSEEIPAAVEPRSWATFKLLYWQGRSPRSAADLIQELGAAYQGRDLERYAALFPSEPGDPSFSFFGPDDRGGVVTWDRSEELRIHRRMFEPDQPLPSEVPVPVDLWLQSIVASLTPVSVFVERPGLYRSETNPDGIDPARWRAEEATYSADVLFDTQGPNDYRVNGQQIFTVIERRNRLGGLPGKYVVDLWEDLGTGAAASKVRGHEASRYLYWTEVKGLYR